MAESWLEMKIHLRVPGSLKDRAADLTSQCLSTFYCGMLSLTSKLKFRRIKVPGHPNRGWVLASDKEKSPVGQSIDDYLSLLTPFTPQVIIGSIEHPLPDQYWYFLHKLGLL